MLASSNRSSVFCFHACMRLYPIVSAHLVRSCWLPIYGIVCIESRVNINKVTAR